MKINTKKYAIALYEATQDLSQAELKNAIGNFVKILAKKGLLAKADKIMADYAGYYNQQQGILPVLAKTAQPLSESEKKEIISRLKKSTGKEIELENQVDKSLIGGLVLKIGDTLVDGSLNNQLLRLKQKLIS